MAVTNEQVVQLLTLMQEQVTLLKEQQGQNNGGNSATKAKRPDRPIINAGMDDREWALLEDTWARYKQMIGANDLATLRMELRAACSTDVNKMLFEFVGPAVLDACTEEELLGHIKSLAVKQVHHEVHQMNFHMMSQEEGEPINRYVARLKAQAFLCQFNVPCGCNPVTNISYADQMVAQRLVAGLCNVDHQRKILAEAGTLTTLDAKIKRLQLLETTEESAGILRGHVQEKPSVAAPQRSQYQRNKRSPKSGSGETSEGPSENGTPCRGCGNTTHPGGKAISREFCPAKNKKCGNCGIKGHFARVCEKAAKTQAAPASGVEESPNPHEHLENIPSNASVSFSFAASASEQVYDRSTVDFRPIRSSKGNT